MCTMYIFLYFVLGNLVNKAYITNFFVPDSHRNTNKSRKRRSTLRNAIIWKMLKIRYFFVIT